MDDKALHAEGLRLFEESRFEDALHRFAQALGVRECAEYWNDWGMAQLALEQLSEAEEAFRRALELDASNADAAINLAALLGLQQRFAEATRIVGSLPAERRPREIEQLDQQWQAALESESNSNQRITEDDLRRCRGTDPNSRSYFDTHLSRYLAISELVPPAQSGQTLLELGTSFHHLTPALIAKGYAVVCSDIWEGAETSLTRNITGLDGASHKIMVHNFDVEREGWPFGDAAFDVVLFCEILEHLARDPMAALNEINRVLKPGGKLLLTTPNLTSAHSVDAVLRGESPYVFGHFTPGGIATDRHNREYTPGELQGLLRAAGFEVERQVIRDSWWRDCRHVLRRLAAGGFRIAGRGDNVLLLAQKTSSVRERFPREFYLAEGGQAERRAHQQSPLEPAEAPLHFLVIHEVLPHSDRSGSDVRLMGVIRGLRDAGHQVTYIARNGKDWERYGPPLQDLGVRVYSGDAERMADIGCGVDQDWTLADVSSGRMIDAAILFHWFWAPVSIPEHYMEDIRRISPATPIVVLSDDRHAERERRYAHLTRGLWDRMRAESFHHREEEIYRAADLVISISEEDRNGMLKDWPELRVEVLPMCQEVRRVEASFDTRHGVLFIGNFDNVANRDGIRWLLEEVWPEVLRRVPGITLTIAGNGAPTDLADHGAGVHVVGHVPDLQPLLDRHLVMAAPIRFGTGVKTKVLTSLAQGLPVVTTTIGAEGLDIVHGEHALIADDAPGFAAALAELCTNDGRWQSLQHAALAHVTDRFSHQSVQQRLSAIVRAVRSLTPEIHQSARTFSVREVEDSAEMPPKGGIVPLTLRFLGHVRRGLELLGSQQFGSACVQFEHAAWFVREAPPATSFYVDLVANYAQACRQAGRVDLARAAEREWQEMATMPVPSLRRTPRRKLPPEISVVIPAYRRPEKLERCLHALRRQSLPSREFEVIVIDDGSGSHYGIEELCASAEKDLRIRYVRQANSGAGAARRTGVAMASGKYLLLINDDTIAGRELLAGHLALQQKYAGQRVAVLGDFAYPPEARKRALTHALNVSPLMFPQRSLSPAKRYGYSHFITCNLSVERVAVEACGSFDSRFRVAEDTELGVRLQAAGYGVVCDVRLKAEHDHLPFRASDWIRRAQSYGAADLLLFRKHPELLGDGTGPFLRLDQTSMIEIARRNEAQREQIEQAVAALQPWDDLDFEPLLRRQGSPAGGDASGIVDLFGRLLPAVHWFYLYEALLSAWRSDSNASSAEPALREQAAEVNVSCSM